MSKFSWSTKPSNAHNKLAPKKNNIAKRRGKLLQNELEFNENNETNVTKRREKPINKPDSSEKEQSERSTSACKRN